MSIDNLGKQIAALRKEKKVTQDELAANVGVSAQAVSKWENGGTPDVELLPKIADFFGVSIDSLFGRSVTDYSDLQTALMKKICDTQKERQMKTAFEFCWNMERALFGSIISDNDSIEEMEKKTGEKSQIYSSIMSDYGFTRMGIANRLQYFLVVPEIKNTDAAFFEGIDYPAFFGDFSDKDVFDACVLLNKRESKNSFTEDYFEKVLKISAEKAKTVVGVLKKYRLLQEEHIELNDEVVTTYRAHLEPSFISLLIFAREIIDRPNVWRYYAQCRTTPYLK